MTDIIAVSGLRKSFGTTEVLRGLDLTVARGTVLALLGPNGAGKTTLISILSTLVRPDAGTVTVAGHDVAREPEAVKAAISLTGQSAAVDDVLTGAENLRMMGRLSGLTRSAAARRADELLARFDLVEARGRRVKTYSGGMRRRLDLAISLLSTPPVVFLDEPTTGLDTRARAALWDIIRDLAATGTTVLLTTQYLEEADQLADRIAVLAQGRIVAQGTAAELKALVGGEVVSLVDASGELVRELPTDGTVEGLRAALDAMGTDAATASVQLRRPSLDDVFLHLTSTPTGADSDTDSRGRELAATKG
ncbi:ATP-binding cassette domain-containing protein [Galbitalea sp. SE-J8]|uniref:ATP-binding cassette domain-containing protein n=1 Tax=Galbitalea sp. SE-J8 TaxID=3054952 RepID=UPI00259C9869|nr:ATP-binding cassette domain-containing protein [Galbitalea sp. SE-J8]MDM4764237.1 ATP-binding cassette domain-containing protein [Galbitalea sp. SE-J8]